jgi:drug/metabolite transporter (DMT)-like permease
MEWFLISLAAPFLWAVVNISDQYLIDKYTDGEEKSPGALVLFSSLTGIFFIIAIALFTNNIFSISLFDKALLSLSGVLTIVWVILYLFALKIEKVSSVAPWFLTIPVFGYIFGFLFLGEVLTKTQQIGSFIMFLGLIILSFDFSDEEKTNFKWKVGLYMVPASLIAAIIGIIFKYVAVADDFWISSFWVYVGLTLAGVFIFIFVPKYRASFNQMIKKGGGRILSLNLFSELISNIGNLLANYATLLAPIVMVYLVESFQPAILLVLTIICTRFFPNIITENMSKRVLVPKIISIAIIVLGSIVLFM